MKSQTFFLWTAQEIMVILKPSCSDQKSSTCQTHPYQRLNPSVFLLDFFPLLKLDSSQNLFLFCVLSLVSLSPPAGLSLPVCRGCSSNSALLWFCWGTSCPFFSFRSATSSLSDSSVVSAPGPFGHKHLLFSCRNQTMVETMHRTVVHPCRRFLGPAMVLLHWSQSVRLRSSNWMSS